MFKLLSKLPYPDWLKGFPDFFNLIFSKWFNLIALVGLACVIALWFWQKRRAGTVLQKLGQPTSHKVLLILAGIVIIFPLLEVLLVFTGGESSYASFSKAFSIFLFGAYLFTFYLGAGGLEIGADGIRYGFSLLKWKRIESYQWKGETSYTLGVNRKGEDFLYWLEGWEISPDQRENAEKLLAQHLPRAPEAAAEPASETV